MKYRFPEVNSKKVNFNLDKFRNGNRVTTQVSEIRFKNIYKYVHTSTQLLYSLECEKDLNQRKTELGHIFD